MCTIKSFPNQIDHTIAWAKEQFKSTFTEPAENVNLYLGTSNFLQLAKDQGMQPNQVNMIKDSLENRPLSFEQCIEWARLKFQDEYNNEIRQLLHSLPRDMITREGTPFWSGPKRAPNPVEFDMDEVRETRITKGYWLSPFRSAAACRLHYFSCKYSCIQLWA